jgi:hypothetical protein
MLTFAHLPCSKELECEIAEYALRLQDINNLFYLRERLDHAGVKVASYALVLIGNFVEACEELPLSIRLYVYCETAILKVSFKIVDRCFNYSSSCVVVLQKFLLAGINSSV